MRLVLILSLLAVLISCDKNESNSAKLNLKEWKITTLTVDGVQVENSLATFHFFGCDIYEANCSGSWKIGGGAESRFYWQFDEKGKKFTLLRKYASVSDPDSIIEEDQQCYDYSGKYDVEKSKAKIMEFTSSETYGYPGKEVKMVIELEK